MLKYALFVIAAGAFAATANASQRGYDLRDMSYWTTSGVTENAKVKALIDSEALAVEGAFDNETAFVRTNRISQENDSGRH